MGLVEKGEKDFYLYDLNHMVNADGLLDLQEEDIGTLRGMMLASFEEPELDLNISELNTDVGDEEKIQKSIRGKKASQA